MLALSPPSFLSFGWPFDDHTSPMNSWAGGDPFLTHDRETETSESFAKQSASQLDVEIDDPNHQDTTGDDPSTAKKINHNANERDRRRKLNNLYSLLRSLLPGAEESKKKLSIPATVSTASKYIAEMQKEVERLMRRKEEILSQIMRQEEPNHPRKIGVGPTQAPLSAPIYSLCRVDDAEVVVQICTADISRNPISAVLMDLEEAGHLVLDTSSFSTAGNKVFLTVHLQVCHYFSVYT
ncbi:hypothetical protein ACLOJK_024698 [Asimina triloba]